MLKRYVGFNYLNLFIFSILFQNSVSAGIGDKYYCEDYANSYYESGLKSNRDNFKFYIQWERNKILKKFDNFPNIYTMEIVQQDSSSFVAWQYDNIGKSGLSVNTLDETYKDNILYIRAHVDSKSKVTSFGFLNAKKYRVHLNFYCEKLWNYSLQ